MERQTDYDLICLGSGPAGQKAAIQAAKAGYRAAVVEREPQVGGACLLSGTIPSKALREQALRYRRIRDSASSMAVELRIDAPLSALLQGVDAVIAAQDRYLHSQLSRNNIALIRGRGTMLDPRHVEVQRLDGSTSQLKTSRIVIATGSRPRHVPHIPVDHEHIVDSDSVLSLSYMPRSMAVLGSGVIACEYASIFAAIGVEVTLIDKAPEPLGFLDPALRAGFEESFAAMGARYLGGVDIQDAQFDGVSQVLVRLRDGETIAADIALAALGRIANLDGIGVERLQLAVSSRGHLQVDERFATNVPGVYAAGDVIGPPALASTAADQGRSAALAALDLQPTFLTDLIPMGVYTIPEIASVGLSETEAARQKVDLIVGTADYGEVARAHIVGKPAGFLRILCERSSARVVGVQAIGESATEIIHLGQAAIAAREDIHYFINHTFNFPTMTEAYRIAAFDCLKHLGKYA